MFRDGLVEETRALCSQGLLECSTARQALGYSQVLQLLAGGLKPDEAIRETVLRTQQFAKRQGTWFRGQCELRWILWEQGTALSSVAEKIVQQWNLLNMGKSA